MVAFIVDRAVFMAAFIVWQSYAFLTAFIVNRATHGITFIV